MTKANSVEAEIDEAIIDWANSMNDENVLRRWMLNIINNHMCSIPPRIADREFEQALKNSRSDGDEQN